MPNPGMKGRTHSKETKRRMAASQQARRARERQERPLSPTEELDVAVANAAQAVTLNPGLAVIIEPLVLAARRLERKARRGAKAL
jgi:hypothetical protein